VSRPLTVADLHSPGEAAFVAAILELGPAGAAEAALRAGYGATPQEAARAAAFLLGSDRIRRVIVTETKARFDTLITDAQNALAEIVRDKSLPASARISAAQEILNRSSVGPIPSRSMQVTAQVGIEDLIARLDAEEAARLADAVDVTPSLGETTKGAAD
jgi:hypothetical protein